MINNINKNESPKCMYAHNFRTTASTFGNTFEINSSFDFVNWQKLGGNEMRRVKVGSVIIMLPNLNQAKLCNRTRLAVKKLWKIWLSSIITGKFKGDDVLITRIPLVQLTLLLNLSVSSFWYALHSQCKLINTKDSL